MPLEGAELCISLVFSHGKSESVSGLIVSDSATPWTVAHQAPLSIRFSSQEYWSGYPFPPSGDLPNPGIEPRSPALQEDSLWSEPPGKPFSCLLCHFNPGFCSPSSYGAGTSVSQCGEGGRKLRMKEARDGWVRFWVFFLWHPQGQMGWDGQLVWVRHSVGTTY